MKGVLRVSPKVQQVLYYVTNWLLTFLSFQVLPVLFSGKSLSSQRTDVTSRWGWKLKIHSQKEPWTDQLSPFLAWLASPGKMIYFNHPESYTHLQGWQSWVVCSQRDVLWERIIPKGKEINHQNLADFQQMFNFNLGDTKHKVMESIIKY